MFDPTGSNTWYDHFIGNPAFATGATANPWVINDTSATGTPTIGAVDGAAAGEFQMKFSSTSEVQNLCLSFGDVLAFDIDLLQSIEFKLKVDASILDTATSLAFGLTGDRNDAIDSIAQAALFRLIGSNSLVVETDDGVINNDDVATGQSLSTSFRRFVIDFTGGKSNVKFYVDGIRVAPGTTFDMSNYSGSLQPFVQLQKTADTTVDGVQVDYCAVQFKAA